MPTTKICGQCAVCHKVFVPGEIAMFIGNVRIIKDKVEPGGISCFHDVQIACAVSHLRSEDRGMICKECWGNIRQGYFRYDILHREAL